MKIEILDLAQQDLIEGYYFYEQQEEGLGDYFLKHLFCDIDSLVVCAGIHSKSYKYFFRALSKKFPFAIYYTIKHNVIFIRAIVDCRKRPSWIHRHLHQ